MNADIGSVVTVGRVARPRPGHHHGGRCGHTFAQGGVAARGSRMGRPELIGAQNQELRVGWVAEGKVKFAVDVVEGLEQAPAAINRLFTGENKGKLIVQVGEEPA